MTVHFIYRSHYDGPTGLHHRSFEDASVLDWFRNRWEGIADLDQADARAREHLGTNVYTFQRLFQAIAEQELPPPRTARELAETLEECLYMNEIKASPHLIQVLTDDDEIELAWYFFDDQYLAKHAGRAAYLLHDDWKLPADVGAGGFKPPERTTSIGKVKGEGRTYLVFHSFWDSGNLDGLEGGYHIDGIRLPELAQYLARTEMPDIGCCFHYDMTALRSQLFPVKKKAKSPEDAFLLAIKEDPDDDTPWLLFADWLAEQGRLSPGAVILERALQGVIRQPLESYPGWKFNPKKSLIQVTDHAAVLCRHVARAEEYHQWYLFDDLWASAHPDLANAILRYARRWDVLTP